MISGSDGKGSKTDPDQLRSMSERYHMLYDQTPIMMKAVDATGHIIEANEAYLNALKYTRDQVTGRLSVDFLTDGSREYVIDIVTPEVERSGSMHDIEVQMVTSYGEITERAVILCDDHVIKRRRIVGIGQNAGSSDSFATLREMERDRHKPTRLKLT